MYTAILKKIEYGVHRECVRVLSKIIFYLLQDSCIPKHIYMYTYIHIYICNIYIYMYVYVCMS